MSSEITWERVVEILGLEPHPEGGRYRQTWVGPVADGRAVGTAIYFLLASDGRSHWHRVDSAEIWHHYAGGPLELSTCRGAPNVDADAADAADDTAVALPEIRRCVLGTDLEHGERPQLIVEPGDWQAARPLAGWTLVGCTVSPGFEFERFELAPPGWSPGADR